MPFNMLRLSSRTIADVASNVTVHLASQSCAMDNKDAVQTSEGRDNAHVDGCEVANTFPVVELKLRSDQCLCPFVEWAEVKHFTCGCKKTGFLSSPM